MTKLHLVRFGGDMPGGQGDRTTFPFGPVVQSHASTKQRHLELHPVFQRKYKSLPSGLGETWPQLFSTCHPAGSAMTLSLPEDTGVSPETWKGAENLLSSQQGLDMKVDGEGGPCGTLGCAWPMGFFPWHPSSEGPCSLHSYGAPWNCLPRTTCLGPCSSHGPWDAPVLE